jgi:hypothetical protein
MPPRRALPTPPRGDPFGPGRRALAHVSRGGPGPGVRRMPLCEYVAKTFRGATRERAESWDTVCRFLEHES